MSLEWQLMFNRKDGDMEKPKKIEFVEKFGCSCSNNDSGFSECDECREKREIEITSKAIDQCEAYWGEEMKGKDEIIGFRDNEIKDLRNCLNIRREEYDKLYHKYSVERIEGVIRPLLDDFFETSDHGIKAMLSEKQKPRTSLKFANAIHTLTDSKESKEGE